MTTRPIIYRRTMAALALAGVLISTSCSRLNKRDDGAGQGGHTSDEGGGNTETTESSNEETGGAATAEKNSLSTDDTLQVEEGVELATDVTGAYLTLPPGVERGGNSVSVFPANPDTKILTFITIRVPVDPKTQGSGAGLLASEKTLLLFYKIKMPDGTVVIGARPVTADQIAGNEIVFQSAHFGVFQAGYVSSPLAQAVEKVTTGDVFTKSEEQAADQFTWSALTATQSETSIKFGADYTSASTVTHCLVRITKDQKAGAEVLRTTVTAPEYVLSPAEQGVSFFAHFACWTEKGVNTPVISSATGAVLPVTAPLALDSSVTVDEDEAATVALTYAAGGSIPDACAVKGVESLKPATCSCDGGTCTATVAGEQNYSGPAALSFTLSYKNTESQQRRVAVAINPVDDAPVATGRNLGAVLSGASELLLLPYDDAEDHPATTCSVTQFVRLATVSACTCTAGSCRVTVQYGSFGTGSLSFTVEANGKVSNTAVIEFTSQATVPPAVLLLNLDFAYPADTSAVTLTDKIKLSGTASPADYEFHLVSQPKDTNSLVKDASDPAKQSGHFQSPTYHRGASAVHFDKFSFALKNKTSGEWLANASPENPAWAYTCSSGEFTMWNQLAEGPDGAYLLCSVEQVIDMFTVCRDMTVTACTSQFRQIADINFSTYSSGSWGGGMGWDADFRGSYDGGGHVIQQYKPDLTSLGGYRDGAGFFGRLGAGAVIENIRMTEALLDLHGYGIGAALNWGLLVGKAEGDGIVIKNIEIDSSKIKLFNDAFNIGGLIGRAGSGVTITDVTIYGVELELPASVHATNVGPVFGSANYGPVLRRIGVESSAKVTFETVGNFSTRVGGFGGHLDQGAIVADSYTRATISCNGTDPYVIGKIVGFAGNSSPGPTGTSTLIENVYAQVVHLGNCSGSEFGRVAGERGMSAPNLSRIHVETTANLSDKYVFGNDSSDYTAVKTYGAGGLNNVEFADWDFVNTWIKLTNRPPQLRR